MFVPAKPGVRAGRLRDNVTGPGAMAARSSWGGTTAVTTVGAARGSCPPWVSKGKRGSGHD